MEHFVEFVHFLNSEKRFEFTNTVDLPENIQSVSEEQYLNLKHSNKKLLRYNGKTFIEFKNYIDSNSKTIKNEITDVFHRQNKEQIIEIHNKLLFLSENINGYKEITAQKTKLKTHNDLSFNYPDDNIETYSQLSYDEHLEISNFLNIEFSLAYEIKELIRKLEIDFSYNKLINANSEITGFKINTTKNIDLRNIYLIVNGELLQCEYDVFKKAFNGEVLKSPLKIKWLLKHRNKCHKRALIYFLSRQIIKSVESDSEFLNKILYCFADEKGNPLVKKSLTENMSQYNDEIEKIESIANNPPWKILVDNKVALIQSYLQS